METFFDYVTRIGETNLSDTQLSDPGFSELVYVRIKDKLMHPQYARDFQIVSIAPYPKERSIFINPAFKRVVVTFEYPVNLK